MDKFKIGDLLEVQLSGSIHLYRVQHLEDGIYQLLNIRTNRIIIKNRDIINKRCRIASKTSIALFGE